jgi:hypothetical protein
MIRVLLAAIVVLAIFSGQSFAQGRVCVNGSCSVDLNVSGNIVFDRNNNQRNCVQYDTRTACSAESNRWTCGAGLCFFHSFPKLGHRRPLVLGIFCQRSW